MDNNAKINPFHDGRISLSLHEVGWLLHAIHLCGS